MIIDFFPPSTRSDAERRARCQDPSAAADMTPDYRRFGYDYFDNPNLRVGYGGYRYDGRYAGAARAMCDHYGLAPGDRVFEMGCAKGFVLVEFLKLGMRVCGLDRSEYAVGNAHPDVAPLLSRGDACRMPFSSGVFDLVYVKDMLPHLNEGQLVRAIRECMRVAKGRLFFEIETGRSERELRYLRQWDVTHVTARPPEWWDRLLADLAYSGDLHYKILIPERDES